MSDVSIERVDVTPDNRTLFIAFLKVGVSGFGGTMPFAHRMLVEKERWLDERAFLDLFAVCQFLPGPNIVNLSIVVGRRFGGPRGSIAAFTGLILLPLLIILVLGVLYGTFGQLPSVKGAFTGVACAAAGLVVAMAIRMGRAVGRTAWQVIIAVMAFVAIALFRWPLVWVLLGMVPLAMVFAAREKH